MMRAAKVQPIADRHLIHPGDVGLLASIRANVKHLDAPAFGEFFQLDMICQSSLAPLHDGLNRVIDFCLSDEFWDADEQAPLPFFGLVSAEIGSALCPPLTLKVADLVIMASVFFSHLQSESDLVKSGDVGLEMFAAGSALTGDRQILGGADDNEHGFFGGDVFRFELGAEV